MSRTVTAPLTFVPQPGEGSVQKLFQRLEETAKAAIAERESSTEETFAQDVFRRAMHRIIDVIAGPEGQQRSVGVAWLSHGENRVLFRQIVLAEERSTFFKAHLTNSHITGMLDDAGILSLIPEPERAEFVRSVLGNWIPASDAWIDGALSAQLSRNTLVASILYWLRHPEEFEGGDEFAARFLRTGPGKALYVPSGYWTMSFSHAMWSTLYTSDELWRALTICAERAPSAFFEAPAEDDIPVSHKVRLALVDSDRFSRLMGMAINSLKSRDGLSAEGFDCLTKRVKLTVIRRPEICPLPLLVKFALDYIDGDGYALFRMFIGQVARHSADYAADLTESFKYIREAAEIKGGAPYVADRIGRIKEALLRNALMHGVDSSQLNLTV